MIMQQNIAHDVSLEGSIDPCSAACELHVARTSTSTASTPNLVSMGSFKDDTVSELAFLTNGEVNPLLYVLS